MDNRFQCRSVIIVIAIIAVFQEPCMALLRLIVFVTARFDSRRARLLALLSCCSASRPSSREGMGGWAVTTMKAMLG
jgi:hypothetical protein